MKFHYLWGSIGSRGLGLLFKKVVFSGFGKFGVPKLFGLVGATALCDPFSFSSEFYSQPVDTWLSEMVGLIDFFAVSRPAG